MAKKTKKTVSNLPERFYSRYNTIKEGKWKRKVKFWLIFALVIFIIFWIAFGGLEIRFTFLDEESNALWSLLTSLVFGMYSHLLGFSIGIRKNKWRVVLVIIILIVYVGFSAYLGLEVTINFPNLFIHKTFGTNTINGVLFFTLNIPIWTIIYFATLLTERED